jgi:hypothetical protein
MASKTPADSWWRLSAEVISARVLVWVAQAGQDRPLTPESHAYFADCYQRLAQHHRARGRLARARRCNARAEEHYRAGGWDGPPYAAAMAMPRPRRWLVTDAVSRIRLNGPGDDAA